MREKQIEEMAKDLNDATFGVNVHTLADHLKPETISGVAEYLYNAGYRKQEWISVDERLPDNHRMVLVVCESTSISAGALIAIGSYGGGFWSLGGADGTLYLTKYMQFVVSHWMELPEMPKGEKNA